MKTEMTKRIRDLSPILKDKSDLYNPSDTSTGPHLGRVNAVVVRTRGGPEVDRELHCFEYPRRNTRRVNELHIKY